MMRGLRPGAAWLSVLFTLTAFAGFAPGPVVSRGLSDALMGDVNSDGLTDIVHDHSVLLNQGDGSFVERDLGILGPDLPHFNGGDAVIALIDVNGDGRPDLLTRDQPSAPPGQDRPAQTYRIYIAGEALHYGPGIEIGKGIQPYVADADGDGKEDLVLVNAVFAANQEVASELTVMISRGDGTFTARVPFRIAPAPQFGSTRNLLARDFNHDNVPDLVIRTQYDLVFLRGTGAGDFAPQQTRYLPNQYFGGWAMESGDIDGDGNLDVALAAFRIVRVFFGDGTGKFPRFASATTPMLHAAAERPPDWQGGNNPRSLALGSFVHAGRTEIAAGTAEGDVVVLAYENGKLREVSRIETEFVDAFVQSAAFREPGKTDLYLTGNYNPTGTKATPRLFYVEPDSADTISRPAGRSRAVRGFLSPIANFDVAMRGDCAPVATERWALTREGVFGLERRQEQTVETVLENGSLYFRLTTPWALAPIMGALELHGGAYKGDVFVKSACGLGDVQFTITAR
jgi:hypothetical protein